NVEFGVERTYGRGKEKRMHGGLTTDCRRKQSKLLRNRSRASLNSFLPCSHPIQRLMALLRTLRFSASGSTPHAAKSPACRVTERSRKGRFTLSAGSLKYLSPELLQGTSVVCPPCLAGSKIAVSFMLPNYHAQASVQQATTFS